MVLLSMLTRIFCAAPSKAGYFIRVFAALLLVYYTIMLCIQAFGCKPISALWNGGGRCVNSALVQLFNGFAGLITDTIILALSIYLVWNLHHLPLTTKIRVAAVLGAGGLTIPTTTFRIYFSFRLIGSLDFTIISVHIIYTAYVDAYPLNNSVWVPLMKYTGWLR